MDISFGNAAHVATVWLPQLQPTRATVISTCLALLFIAAAMTGAVVLFMVYCLEKPFDRLRTALTFVGCLMAIALCAGGTQRISGTNTISDPDPSVTSTAAVATARSSAAPRGAWIPRAHEVSAAGRTVQTGWTKQDRQTVSAAVERVQGVTAEKPGAQAAIVTKPQPEAWVAQHGTSYLKGGEKLRCVVQLTNVQKNNVGQPVSAHLEKVSCAKAANLPS